ncbi:hypothetical protein DFH07DRAFT_1065675 [Mycena maculata]|uniref:Uncharacterized protein n=1 Tax=Mycena maculata TaxID=230809 RepID=A0AAD7HZG3_9AGAR|nr:hypothetical protein DFH07DRAFT_1065675 [Mycena maculata]
MSRASSPVALLPVRPPTPKSSASSSRSSTTATPWTYTTVVEPSHTPRSEVKDLPRPPSILYPLRKHETTGRAPPPRRRKELPPQGLGWLVVIPGLIVALVSAGLATSLFLYLALRTDGNAPSFLHGFLVDEMRSGTAPLFGLLASTVTTNVIWLVGFPVLVSMAAYCVAGSWLSHQQHPRSERPNLLTPLQYGLLFKLMSSPGPASSYEVGSYLINRRARVDAPSFFTTAFLLVSGVLGISYLISLADIWLHAAAAVVLLQPQAAGPASDATFAASASPQTLSPPSVLRGHYPLAPTVTYLLLLYLHALLATALTLWTVSLRSPVLRPVTELPLHSTTWPAPPVPTALRLAHLHLRDALAPVAARLSGRREAHPALGRLGRGLFVEDLNTARVEVGVWARDGERRRWGDTTGDRVFGVYKKVLPYKGEIY